MQRKISRGAIAALAAAGLLLIAALAAYFALRPATTPGGKTISVEIVAPPAETKAVEISTDAEFLRQALEERNLIQGDESAYGLFVTVVDGIAADSAKQEWWRFTKAGEELLTGVDTTPIQDGEKYEITLTTGY
jgi:hypothetical protein